MNAASRQPPRMSLLLTAHEVDLLLCALARWRINIADADPKDRILFYDPGQQIACQFTTRRVDELRQRLADLSTAAANDEGTTP